MSTPDPETSSTSLTQTIDDNDEEIAKNSRQRFVAWAALLLVSCVALASKVAAATAPYDRLSWILFSVSITSIVCSFIAIMGYAVSPQGFFGSVFEGFFAVVCQIVWIVGMPFIMDPDRDIAVSKVDTGEGTEFTFIRNANIYFFSWASTICIVCVLGRFVRQQALEKRKKTQEESNRDATDEQQRAASPFLFSPRTSFWFLLTLASLVVLVDATEIFSAFSCEDQDSCMRTRYALSLGAVGTFLSLGCSVLATCGLLNTFFELLFSFFLVGLYLAGVGLITFGDGPGASLGNLYFATWMGACISTVLLGRSFQGIVRHGFQSGSEHQAAKPSVAPLQTANETPEEPLVFPDIEMGNVDTSEQNNNPFDVDSPVAAKEEVSAPVIAVPAASLTESSEQAEIAPASTPDDVIVEAEVVTQAEEESVDRSTPDEVVAEEAEEESVDRSTPDEVVAEAEGVNEAEEDSANNDEVEEGRSESEKAEDDPVEVKPDKSDSDAKEEEKEEESEPETAVELN